MAKEAKRKLNPENYFPIYYWMSNLTTVKRDKEGDPVTDTEGNIIREPLSGVPKEIYAIVYRFSVGKNGCCNMSYADLVKVTGTSTSTVSRALKLLILSDLILDEYYTTGELNKNGQDIITSKYYRVKKDPLEKLGKELEINLTKALDVSEEKPNQWNDYEKREAHNTYIERHREKLRKMNNGTY